MKKILVPTLIASAIASLAAVPSLAQAQESTLSYNVGVVSDYRYRGISQSRLEPAVQGGIDYADKSGFYVGVWGSTIKWIKDSGATKGNVEVDLYGGYKGTAGGVAYDVGFLRYEYVNNTLGNQSGFVNANTNEVYGALTYGVFTAKYSHAISNLFGNPNSKNSYYLDLSANFDLGNGFTLTPHVGRQMVNNLPTYSYNDYSVTLAKDLGNGLSASLMLVDTNAKVTPYTWGPKYVGKSGAVVGLKYTF
jgi:uncharacterized protein (TIGR02001 family)